jgi:hypothetical protein
MCVHVCMHAWGGVPCELGSREVISDAELFQRVVGKCLTTSFGVGGR